MVNDLFSFQGLHHKIDTFLSKLYAYEIFKPYFKNILKTCRKQSAIIVMFANYAI